MRLGLDDDLLLGFLERYFQIDRERVVKTDTRIALSDDEFEELRDSLREIIGFGEGSEEVHLMQWLTKYFQVAVLDSGYMDTVDRLTNGNAR